MKHKAFLFALTLVAAALAGCANEPAGDDQTTPTNSTTPATSTPAATPITTPSPGTEGNASGEGNMTPPVCDEPAATPAPLGTLLGYPEVVVTVEEPSGEADPCFQFVAPETATAGWTAITLRNNGRAPHIMPMYFIGNHTLEEAVQVLASGGQPPAWVEAVGGVGFVTPFQNGTALLDLKEGNYLLVCFFAGHHMQGMYRLLTVEHSDEHNEVGEHEEGEEPVANYTVVGTDYNFTLPEANFTAGLHIVRFVNNGSEVHEFPLMRLNEGTTVEQFLEAVESRNPTGPPPGVGIGGVNRLSPGQDAYAIVDLRPGTHALLCVVSSPAHGGAPHTELGMTQEFVVA